MSFVNCEYCEKELSKDKGELAHGCLDCYQDIRADKIIKLERENKVLKDWLVIHMKRRGLVVKLERENKVLKEALEFYADEKNWEDYGDYSERLFTVISEAGHETARTALREIGE